MNQDPLPALDRNHLKPPSQERLGGPVPVRTRSLSRLLPDEAERPLVAMGRETRRSPSKEATAACSIAEARTG